MSSTLITALYDINREKDGDGRTVNQYLEWFDKTLQLNTNFVIYTEPKFLDFIKSRRNENNTKIIVSSLDQIPYYKYHDKMKNILQNDEYRKKMKDVNRIECNLVLYNIIQYSKFDWIKDAIHKNFFNSSHYFWIDAGCSRFFDYANISNTYPNLSNLDFDSKFLIQGNVNTQPYFSNWPGADNYIWDNNSILVGTFFGGKADTCIKIGELVQKKFEYYLERNIVNNEQIIIAIICKENQDLFYVYIDLNGKHLPLFKKLAT